MAAHTLSPRKFTFEAAPSSSHVSYRTQLTTLLEDLVRSGKSSDDIQSKHHFTLLQSRVILLCCRYLRGSLPPSELHTNRINPRSFYHVVRTVSDKLSGKPSADALCLKRAVSHYRKLSYKLLEEMVRLYPSRTNIYQSNYALAVVAREHGILDKVFPKRVSRPKKIHLLDQFKNSFFSLHPKEREQVKASLTPIQNSILSLLVKNPTLNEAQIAVKLNCSRQNIDQILGRMIKVVNSLVETLASTELQAAL
ncbi:hypothetical protein HZC07_02360 [Candidatus Micrarchaeota archaeon]|nr:hypothetical protein [Candidatus Micrarchaeota archaeon]